MSPATLNARILSSGVRALYLGPAFDLAAHRTLQHLFKTCTGLPLRRFRIWNRMGVAIAAVSAGASLTVAAHRAGFSSSAHFSTAFRAMFGLCPSDLVAAGLRRHPPHELLAG